MVMQFEVNNKYCDMCNTEFKMESTLLSLLKQQESKNLRTNCCILNDLNVLDADMENLLAMEWSGNCFY